MKDIIKYSELKYYERKYCERLNEWTTIESQKSYSKKFE